MAARNYDFHAGVPFQITDILDLHAVVKHSVPMCADARDLLENGKLKLAEVSYLKCSKWVAGNFIFCQSRLHTNIGILKIR